MAKNFPYFKFIASEWLTGDIVFEDYSTQGLFINICALYWQRDGDITYEDLLRRYKDESLLGILLNKYIHNNAGKIEIKFLNEQLVDANHVSKVNSENGKKGAEAKRNKATAKRPLSDPLANFSKEEEKKIKKELNESINVPFDSFWDLYDKKVGEKDKLIKKWEALKDDERLKAMQHAPKYKESQPDKKYRKDPATYLNNKSFNDEIISQNSEDIFSNNQPSSGVYIPGVTMAVVPDWYVIPK